MNRSARTLTAGLVAAISFGVAAPPAVAAAAGRPTHAQVDKADKADKGQKASSSQGNAGQAQGQLERLIQRTDRALARATTENRVSKLAVIGGTDTRAVVIANISADRAGVAAATSVEQVKQYRPVNYVLVVNVLRQAAKVQTQSDALGGDAEVDALVGSAVEKALAVTALTPKDDIKAARADLAAARSVLEAVVAAPPAAEHRQ